MCVHTLLVIILLCSQSIIICDIVNFWCSGPRGEAVQGNLFLQLKWTTYESAAAVWHSDEFILAMLYYT